VTLTLKGRGIMRLAKQSKTGCKSSFFETKIGGRLGDLRESGYLLGNYLELRGEQYPSLCCNLSLSLFGCNGCDGFLVTSHI